MRSPDTRHLAPDNCQFPQRLVHIPRRPIARDLPRQLHTRRHRGVWGHARERAQLIGSEPEDVVEAGIRGRELEHGVELDAAPQHTGRELVGEAPVAVDEAGERPVARGLQRGARPHRVEHL